jgi:hypothetical protein
MTETQRLYERAKEPVSQCMIRRLLLPSVYWDAPWPTPDRQVDLLVVDRAGVGDVHIVEIKRRAADAIKAIPQVMAIPAQYKWIAFYADTLDRKTESAIAKRKMLFPDKGPGCVGVIAIERTTGSAMEARILVPAERFPGSYDEELQLFSATHKPDISFE